jgi:hypothetical protein
MRIRVFLGLGLAGFALQASARSPAEVACDEAKLGRLVHRVAFDFSSSNLFVWPVAGNHFSGLAVLPRFSSGIRNEWQMGFDLLLDPGSDRLNPRRPLLPQAVLARNDLLTTPFKPPTEDPRIDVSLELAREVIDPQAPTQGIVINNQAGRPTGSASGAGRALAVDGLFDRCPGEEPSPFDLQVFEILSRTLRISEALLRPFPGQGGDRFKAIVFRDVERLSYRVKVYLYSTIEGEYSESTVQLRIRFGLNGGGGWAAGGIESLPWCDQTSPPCTNLLNPGIGAVVAPPIFAGHEVQTQTQYLSGAFLNIPFETSPDNILTDDVPWPELLRGTAWERPVGVP